MKSGKYGKNREVGIFQKWFCVNFKEIGKLALLVR